MHSYDPSRAPAHASTVSPMRPAVSHTPIYDALYSEYLRAFRTLPGDRTGEEDLGFTAFSYGSSHTGAVAPYGGGSYGSGWNGSAWQTDPWPAAYAPAPPAPQPSYAYAGSATGGAGGGENAGTGPGYGNGRQHHTGMHHIPAALPPAPRRGY
ncbi:hypothetical protein ACS04_25020 [Streptomyces roseus]|uniref:Uncharacterized protein n=2 Tax=Streptomyces roseus TaxID=66430 RepID=A0A0J6XIZ8_9ACTN|nr:hypothetical protein ACS04_25020 [Streptomyces roseus]